MSETANTSTVIQTLDGFMGTAWGSADDLAGLDWVIGAIADGARQVQAQVQAAAIQGALGGTGETNVHGEMVQQLDSAGSDIFVESLRQSGSVAAVGSEEIEGVEVIGGDESRRYVVQMDPVDGSSNIDVAVTIGSIFGIWRRGADDAVTESLLLRPGREQVAAAYVVYGSSTVLVVATPGDVNGFTLDGSGEFLLTHPGITIPDECEYYSTNEGNFGKLDGPTQAAVEQLRDSHSLRYVGSLVADFHRNLLKGGVFLYPGDVKSPEGKLRLMYEANPLGYVAEQAGGAAYSGLGADPGHPAPGASPEDAPDPGQQERGGRDRIDHKRRLNVGPSGQGGEVGYSETQRDGARDGCPGQGDSGGGRELRHHQEALRQHRRGVDGAERRDYREMLFRTAGANEYISGVILYDETLRQEGSDGTPLVDVIRDQGMIPGIKVDKSGHPLAGAPGEQVTEGLDGLRDRLEEYAQLGARFTKWPRHLCHWRRDAQPLLLGGQRPRPRTLRRAEPGGRAGAHGGARGADGRGPRHRRLLRSDGDGVARDVLPAWTHRVALEGTVLKTNMVLSGKDAAERADASEVAERTVECSSGPSRRPFPASPSCQGARATRRPRSTWTGSTGSPTTRARRGSDFSYGRGLQAAPLKAWGGDNANLEAVQQAYFERACQTAYARQGAYDPDWTPTGS